MKQLEAVIIVKGDVCEDDHDSVADFLTETTQDLSRCLAEWNKDYFPQKEFTVWLDDIYTIDVEDVDNSRQKRDDGYELLEFPTGNV